MEAIIAYLVVVGALVVYIVKKFINWYNTSIKGKK